MRKACTDAVVKGQGIFIEVSMVTHSDRSRRQLPS